MMPTHLMNQVIEVRSKTGLDRYGSNTLGTSREVRCRFEFAQRTIVTVDHEREPIDGRVFIPASETVNVGDQCIYKNIEYRVMRVADQVGGNGKTNHFELLVQLWSTNNA